MPDSIKVSATFSVPAQRLYEAWLDSIDHSAFTGAKAVASSKVGGKFSAWDGYITGKTLELKPFSRIVQAWRTNEFPKGAPDSRLEITLEKAKGGTRITLTHSNIPTGQGKAYEDGWFEFYFEPMQEYFGKSS
jgi:activator of HSP90 ATPase